MDVYGAPPHYITTAVRESWTLIIQKPKSYIGHWNATRHQYHADRLRFGGIWWKILFARRKKKPPLKRSNKLAFRSKRQSMRMENISNKSTNCCYSLEPIVKSIRQYNYSEYLVGRDFWVNLQIIFNCSTVPTQMCNIIIHIDSVMLDLFTRWYVTGSTCFVCSWRAKW